MTLTLTVERSAWLAGIDEVLAAHPGCIPVVKGNGYGFGRPRLLAEITARAIPHTAIGTVHELAGVPATMTSFVLTPVADPSGAELLSSNAVPVVGSSAHVEVLRSAGWRGSVVVKLASSMRRYGVEPGQLSGLLAALDRAGLRAQALSLHLPLAPSADNLAEAVTWAAHLTPYLAGRALHVSHLDHHDEARLRDLTGSEVCSRIGTRLWHADRRSLWLSADVLQVRSVSSGDPVGYRALRCPSSGSLVMIGAGTAHGVHPRSDGASPFHFAGRRLTLAEPPHMHTSMVVVPAGDPCPSPGDAVDVQRPLTQSMVDEVVER